MLHSQTYNGGLPVVFARRSVSNEASPWMVSKIAIHNGGLGVALITLGLSLASRAENFCNDYSELNAAPSQLI